MLGRYRDSDEPMQIVSGPISKEKVHYEAPASRDVPREMRALLEWWERTRHGADVAIDGLLRAGIAHVWFETIHPFEDGNGRVGRCLIHYVLRRRDLATSFSQSGRRTAIRRGDCWQRDTKESTYLSKEIRSWGFGEHSTTPVVKVIDGFRCSLFSSIKSRHANHF